MPPPTSLFLYPQARKNSKVSATLFDRFLLILRPVMDNQEMKGLSFNTMDTLRLTAMPALGNYPSNGHIAAPQKTPSPSISRPSVHFAPDINLNSRSSVNMDQPPPDMVQFEEQPSWLDDLLDEPEMPVNKSVHRRSRSDSVTYFDTTDCRAKEDLFCPNLTPLPTFDFQKCGYYKELLQNSAYGKPISPDDQQHGLWNSSFGSSTLANGLIPHKDDAVSKIPGLTLPQQEQNEAFPMAEEKKNQGESATQYTENSDASASKAADAKPAKQHNARRSRVRKVQYIAELERSIHVLHAEGSRVSAELEFLDHQNLILSMENRALKQRLESLSQVQVIMSLQQDVLEREIGRLQYLYHQQNIFLQQQQQIPNHAMHRRVRSCNDFESQIANLSLRPKGAGPSSDVFQDPQHRV